MGYWQGKVVLVTGGSAGLGLALASAFAEAGARVALAARDAERLAAAVDALRATGAAAEAFPADVTQTDAAARLVEQAMRWGGRLDALVNNVGRSTRGLAIETTPERFAELFDVNFLSMVRCARAAAPHLLAQRGHLVNIGSLSSKTAPRYLGAYPVSKFAVAAYSQQLRYELGPQGLHVLLVCPGPLRRDDAGARYAEEAAGLPPAALRPGGTRLRGLEAEYVARRVLRACERRQAELVLPGKARLLFALAQLWPALGDWILEKMTQS